MNTCKCKHAQYSVKIVMLLGHFGCHKTSACFKWAVSFALVFPIAYISHSHWCCITEYQQGFDSEVITAVLIFGKTQLQVFYCFLIQQVNKQDINIEQLTVQMQYFQLIVIYTLLTQQSVIWMVAHRAPVPPLWTETNTKRVESLSK